MTLHKGSIYVIVLLTFSASDQVSLVLDVFADGYAQYDSALEVACSPVSLVDIGVGFAAVGLLSMRGILGYEGWRWLFLIE